MIRNRVLLFFIILIKSQFFINAQIVERASIMRAKEYGYSTISRTHLYRSLNSGKKVITGIVGNGISYQGYNSITSNACLNFLCSAYIGVLDQDGILLWIKYLNNGYVEDVVTDSKDNIYLTGVYSGKLATSSGDTMQLLSNNSNIYGNIFVIKLDSTGNTKWMKTTDNEARGQSTPNGVYLKTDKADNIYLAGYFDYFIRFNSQISFYNPLVTFGFQPFLARLDSNGSFKWVRIWNSDLGLPCGLKIDSCRIYMYNIQATSQPSLRIRKYDFAGKLLERKTYPFNSIYNYTFENVDVQNDKLLILYDTTTGQKIGYFNLNGTKIWDFATSPVAMQQINFTIQNKIFFAGECLDDSCLIKNNIIHSGPFWGYLDLNSNIILLKNINRTYYLRDSYLAPTGKFYFNSAISLFSNPYNDFSIDTITFQNLSYFDTASGTNGGYYYRLYAQYQLGDGRYFDLTSCTFNPINNNCLDQEGIDTCNIITGVIDLDADKSIKVFPNPSAATFFINFQNFNEFFLGETSISTINGVLIKKRVITSSQMTLTLENAPRGVYLLKIMSRKNKLVVKKIIVE